MWYIIRIFFPTCMLRMPFRKFSFLYKRDGCVLFYFFGASRFCTSMTCVWSTCLIWYKVREVMKRNDKYICLYIYNVTCSQFECWKTTVLADTRLKNQLLWILTLSFSTRPFTDDATRGVIVSPCKNW